MCKCRAVPAQYSSRSSAQRAVPAAPGAAAPRCLPARALLAPTRPITPGPRRTLRGDAGRRPGLGLGLVLQLGLGLGLGLGLA